MGDGGGRWDIRSCAWSKLAPSLAVRGTGKALSRRLSDRSVHSSVVWKGVLRGLRHRGGELHTARRLRGDDEALTAVRRPRKAREGLEGRVMRCAIPSPRWFSFEASN